ncbi:MAG: cytochrome c-type biogenesis protein [Burkholderiales bacterium]
MSARTLARFAAALALAAATALAQPAADEAFEQRLKRLETDLRCLVCQNQTLADSNAPLAEDLRREVRELAQAGKSDAEIRAFLVARYGDFVLYKPPVKESTWLLWFGPFLLLGGGLAVWLAIVRRRRRAVPAEAETDAPSPDAAARAKALLDETSSG